MIVNPLDVAKTRLQAQAAGVPCSHPLSNITSRMAFFGAYHAVCGFRVFTIMHMCWNSWYCISMPTRLFQYKSTLDVFYKIIRQECDIAGRVCKRGTNAGLALAGPTVGIYLPCYDIFRNWLEKFTAHNAPSMSVYVPLVSGSLACSLACATCYPIELARTRMQDQYR
ncbi:hypothetical protein M0R45_038090 [Rubus argutus]|uniref:Mitochondrial carrier protein n=1 Tax=Rubus argutus TaxID=59490 RepID=A0AAW1W194_RUBAR